VDEIDRKVIAHVHEYGKVTTAPSRTVQNLLDVGINRARDILADMVERRVLRKTSAHERDPGVEYGPGARFPAGKKRKVLVVRKSQSELRLRKAGRSGGGGVTLSRPPRQPLLFLEPEALGSASRRTMVAQVPLFTLRPGWSGGTGPRTNPHCVAGSRGATRGDSGIREQKAGTTARQIAVIPGSWSGKPGSSRRPSAWECAAWG
jgi:hypothetical protein